LLDAPLATPYCCRTKDFEVLLMSQFEVRWDKLSWRCDLSFLPFTCTADMTPLEDFIGQERAIRAIQFGLDVDKPGFNIFVTGLTGTGKTTIIKTFLKKVSAERFSANGNGSSPSDWCYVYNFDDADRPRVIELSRGSGKVLQADMDQLVQYLKREGKKMFESEEFARQRQAVVDGLQKKQQELMEALVAEAGKNDFTLRMTPSGIVLLPSRDGKPMQESEYQALSAGEKKKRDEKRAEIETRVEETLRQGKKVDQEISQRVEELEKQAGEYLVRIPMSELKEKYSGHPKILKYLDGVREHILENLHRFRVVDDAPAVAIQSSQLPSDPFLPYRVNVFVDNSDSDGLPTIVETNPSYHNLLGVIEKKVFGTGYITDFTLIKAGSISRANGGYLVLYDRDVLANSGVWEALQRVIKNREVRIEEPAAFFGWAPPQGLRPEPIPTDTKVIMIGDPSRYRALATMDPDFRETFKVKAISIPRSSVPSKTSPPSRASLAITAAGRDYVISVPTASLGSSSTAPDSSKIRRNSQRGLAIGRLTGRGGILGRQRKRVAGFRQTCPTRH
jgi:predicted ATP-dependent protease